MKQAFFSSPIGLVRIMVKNGHVTHLEFTDEETQAVGSYTAEAQACSCVDGEDGRVAMETLRQLEQYFKGERRDFDLPLCPLGTDFQRKAWQVLRQIPYGETISYGEQPAEWVALRAQGRWVEPIITIPSPSLYPAIVLWQRMDWEVMEKASSARSISCAWKEPCQKKISPRGVSAKTVGRGWATGCKARSPRP